jgi:hypothetical protein
VQTYDVFFTSNSQHCDSHFSSVGTPAMSYETEDERITRIRDVQVRNRASTTTTAKARKFSNSAKKPPSTRIPSKMPHKNYADHSSGMPLGNPWSLPLGGVRDVIIGFSYGLLPALLAAIFLPDMWKLLALVILVIASTAGYLLGDASS